MFFRSDNCAEAAPEIMEAVVRANESALPSYGGDALSVTLAAEFARLFDRDIAFALVATGTGANALALCVVTPPDGAVLCHENAHIRVSEQGAVEFFTGGAHLIGVPGAHGKIDPHALEKILNAPTSRAPSCLSLTQLTETGEAYSLEEMKVLAAIARGHGLRIHVDGARIANALAGSEILLSQLCTEVHVDVLSFGATKNGALSTDAVILFDDALRNELAVRQKRSGHVFSKQRFLAAQWNAYLEGDFWLRLARRANDAAQTLACALAEIDLLTLKHAVDGNILFVKFPTGALSALNKQDIPFYVWEPDVIRMVTAFNTPDEEIAGALEELKRLCA